MSRAITEGDWIPEPNTGCWIWLKGVTSAGYGSTGFGILAHRVSFTQYKTDPGHLHVLHKCDTRLCVNPEHLFLGTNADNMADKAKKGRAFKKMSPPLIEVALSLIAGGESMTAVGAALGVARTTIAYWCGHG